MILLQFLERDFRGAKVYLTCQPWAWSDPSASVSWALGLKVYTHTSGFPPMFLLFFAPVLAVKPSNSNMPQTSCSVLRGSYKMLCGCGASVFFCYHLLILDSGQMACDGETPFPPLTLVIWLTQGRTFPVELKQMPCLGIQKVVFHPE